MPILLNRTLRLFLDSIGRRDEYEFYLNKFSAEDTAAFAILCPDRAGFEDVAPMFTFDLEALLRLELSPLILLCGKEGMEVKELLQNGAHPYAARPFDTQTTVETVGEFMRTCRQAERIPVLFDVEGSYPETLKRLVPAVSRRVHFIRVDGPLRTLDGHPLFYYYSSRMNPEELDPEERSLVEGADRLLEHCSSAHISVASPWNLLQELFTIKGAGCVIRKGSQIDTYKGHDGVDFERLKGLLEESFGRSLVSEAPLQRAGEMYIEANYRGAALLEIHPAGHYLSKFAVGKQARGEGLANELWQAMDQQVDRLFWRARLDNPINHWYEKRSEGQHTVAPWRVFWKGIQADDLPAIIRYSLDREEDFGERQ